MGEILRLLAAGSLSRAMTGLGLVAGRPVAAAFGPSGLLRAGIEGGAPWDVFASADTSHPARLRAADIGTAPRVFRRNTLALRVRPGLTRPDAAAASTTMRWPRSRSV
ncbi:MAG: hypothetical protein EA355_13895 [Rhodobacteraceae bacterium]|nr:MAG: hypothetical protein EA355_13895 [Paracoccaceae bacterium]